MRRMFRAVRAGAGAVMWLGVALALSPVAQASEMRGSYLAVIGAPDLTNSSGARLRQPAQVLRQDRANVHRFGIRQEGDDVDPFFDDPAKRNEMAAMLRRGRTTPEAARAIVAGDVSVFVRVYDRADGDTAIDVIVLR